MEALLQRTFFDRRKGSLKAAIQGIVVSNRVRLITATLLGFVNGYFVLHPASMVVFQAMARSRHYGIDKSSSVWASFLSSFHPSMLPMGLTYGVLGALVGLVYSFQRLTIQRQRDGLNEHLIQTQGLLKEIECKSEQLASQNRQLVELQDLRHRTTHFLVHDMKNQLGCIEVFSSFLLEDKQMRSGATLIDSLQRIQRQARALANSVNNLLGIARLENKPTLRLQKINPYDELLRVADNMRYPSNEYHIMVDPTSIDCPEISAECELIYRVLVNLVSNAIKHNSPGTTVVLSARVSANNNQIVFSCRDDGQGISVEQFDRLFEAFYSGDNAIRDSTGLGLAFAQSVVEAHQGRIWCQGPSNDGAEFRFTIPVQQTNREIKDEYTTAL